MNNRPRCDIYAHPSITTSPEYIWAIQERLGLRAVVEGRRVRLVGEPRWSGRPAPDVVEQRAGSLFVVGGRDD